ncbi:hypothetical protein EON65_28215 [archaeon]|nr:MAG: hypothetical protein EON65_28215 [archaeon]
MLGLIKDGLDIIKAIYELREQLKENDTACIYLADRAKGFEQFFRDWQINLQRKLPVPPTTSNTASPSVATIGTSTSSIPTDLTSLELSLTQLRGVLQDVHGFIAKYRKGGSWFSKAKGLAMKVAWRNARKKEMQSLNQRLNDCVSNLLPGQLVDVEEQLRKTVEDTQDVLGAMLEEVMGELVGLGGQSSEQMGLLAEIRKDVADAKLAASSSLSQQLQQLEKTVGMQGGLS